MNRPSRGIFRLFLLAAAVALNAADERLRLEDLPLEHRRSMQQEARLVISLLENHHYASRPFVELEPADVINAYLRVLDPRRLYFLESDVRFMQRRFARSLMSSYLLSGDLYPAFDIFETYAKRVLAREDWIERRLEQPFDLDGDATFAWDRAEAPWPPDEAAADTIWERLLTEVIIAERLAGGDAAETMTRVARRHEGNVKYLLATHPDDIQEMFLNAVLSLLDPHSGYDSASTLLDREVEMSGALVGIGVNFALVDGAFVIEGVVAGGAADLSGAVKAGDRIVAFAEPGEPFTSVHGMRLRELARTLRGEPDSAISIAIETPGLDGRREVTLQRTAIQSGLDRARAFLVTVPRNNTARCVGVIEIPGFYGPAAAEAAAPGVSADVAQLLTKLKANDVDGIVLDLRDNPGGLTSEGVRVAGHFIDEGPVMLTRGANGRIDAGVDEVPGSLYSGPLVVLTSSSSASASELVAGALQSYRRALVVGEASTFGKGTAQVAASLADFAGKARAADTSRWGGLRLTGQKFYLADGRSTQRRGVASDIVLPAFQPLSLPREADLPGALPWDTIPVEDFAATRERALRGVAQWDEATREELVARSRERREAEPEFDWLRRAVAAYARSAERETNRLNLQQRLAEQRADEVLRRELRREGRRIGQASLYAVRVFELDAVIAQQRAHVFQAAGVAGAEEFDWANRCVNGVFYHQPHYGGMITEVRVNRLDRERLNDDVVELAQAFSAAAGVELPDETLSDVFSSGGSDVDLTAVIADAAGLSPEAVELEQGLSAMIRRAIELDPPIVGAPSVLDVSLRESVRVALDWADLRAAEASGEAR